MEQLLNWQGKLSGWIATGDWLLATGSSYSRIKLKTLAIPYLFDIEYAKVFIFDYDTNF